MFGIEEEGLIAEVSAEVALFVEGGLVDLRLAERVGMGGFGAVYRATGAGEGAEGSLEYAVKVLHEHYCTDAKAD